MSDSTRKNKLIEVALPLDHINEACKADKDRKTGTIRNLHKWFAPMPLPAWRALLFAALIDDPEDDNQRVYLLDLIKRLVANGADLPDERDLTEAKRILRKQFPSGLPTVMDPFCGGGSTLVEAQRLGLVSEASDLNPVPALITRVLTDLLPSVSGGSALHPHGASELLESDDSADDGLFRLTERDGPLDGVAADVEYYAAKIRATAQTRLRSAFESDRSGRPVAWLWARTVPCVNPACGAEAILTTSWWLSKKKGALAWVEPIPVGQQVVLKIHDQQRSGTAPQPPKVGRGASFACCVCAQIIGEADVRSLASAGKMGLRMVAVAVDESGSRRYRAPTDVEIAAACNVDVPDDLAELSLGPANQYVAPPRYGLAEFADLYTPRQLRVLATFSDLVAETFDEMKAEGATGQWAKAVTTILALGVGQLARFGSSLCQWRLRATANAKAEAAFSRADLPMMWDFAETNFDGGSVGDWTQICASITRAFSYVVPGGAGSVTRQDARVVRSKGGVSLIATDPPYFDAIGYADLSDFFYMWHRRSLRSAHPDLYQTIKSPRDGELTAFAWHHGGAKEAAREYFISGFTETFRNLQKSLHPEVPMLIVYASKEQKGGSEEETRWSSILTAIVAADLEIVGTWPVHGTGSTRMRGIGANAVATYIVMVCRPRPDSAATASLADFTRSLRRELPSAIRNLQAASILPVDLAQAAMGPGMQIFSRYRAVLDQAGRPVGVELALRLINAALAEVMDEQEGDLDPESRFAIRWWDTYGWETAPFGEADKTARPLGIGVDDVMRAQVVTSQANKVQLLGSGQLDRNWLPNTDITPTAWEAVHHLVDRLVDGGGELEAARLMAALGKLQDPAMELAYRLHDIAAKKGRTADQERYNALISSWTELIRLSSHDQVTSERLF
ncbi:DUF1156 domain-containing protein [Nocardiopsis alba]|uniref:DUF1156 domain-containing protein n=1 Tax=Nocardiopsis alba TaxID=53437 RepID=UPI0035D66B6B